MSGEGGFDFGYNKNEISLISESTVDEYVPIQKNTKLFKFILFTSKVEIKFNSLIRLIYYTSLFELGLWFVGFLLFTILIYVSTVSISHLSQKTKRLSQELALLKKELEEIRNESGQ